MMNFETIEKFFDRQFSPLKTDVEVLMVNDTEFVDGLVYCDEETQLMVLSDVVNITNDFECENCDEYIRFIFKKDD